MHKCFSFIDSRENAMFYFILKPGDTTVSVDT